MVVFDFKNISFAARNNKEIYLIGLGVIFIWAIVSIVLSFAKKNYDGYRVGFFRKLCRLVVSCGLIAVLFIGNGHLRDSNFRTYEKYEKYVTAYQQNEIKKISGTVENFADYSAYKTFSMNGVEFKVRSAADALSNRPEGDSGNILYYTYQDASTTYNYNVLTNRADMVYKPESCVIGANQKLELHYIEEFGEKRILFIKELG